MKNKKKLFLIQIYLLILLFPHLGFSKNYFVIWNVGQGQWTSVISSNECLHFDMGGEHLPYKKVHSFCLSKENKIFLSHWDLDHISGVRFYSQSIPKICLFKSPYGKTSPSKLKLISNLPLCPHLIEPFEQKINIIYEPKNFKKNDRPNDLSRVFIFDSQFLIPGDSTTEQEKIWSKNSFIRKTKVLVLGHHGSRTSSSIELLNHLPRLKMAIASARHKKYGHPHGQIIKRIHQQKVPLLKTEEWGNIWIEF